MALPRVQGSGTRWCLVALLLVCPTPLTKLGRLAEGHALPRTHVVSTQDLQPGQPSPDNVYLGGEFRQKRNLLEDHFGSDWRDKTGHPNLHHRWGPRVHDMLHGGPDRRWGAPSHGGPLDTELTIARQIAAATARLTAQRHAHILHQLAGERAVADVVHQAEARIRHRDGGAAAAEARSMGSRVTDSRSSLKAQQDSEAALAGQLHQAQQLLVDNERTTADQVNRAQKSLLNQEREAADEVHGAQAQLVREEAAVAGHVHEAQDRLVAQEQAVADQLYDAEGRIENQEAAVAQQVHEVQAQLVAGEKTTADQVHGVQEKMLARERQLADQVHEAQARMAKGEVREAVDRAAPGAEGWADSWDNDEDPADDDSAVDDDVASAGDGSDGVDSQGRTDQDVYEDAFLDDDDEGDDDSEDSSQEGDSISDTWSPSDPSSRGDAVAPPANTLAARGDSKVAGGGQGHSKSGRSWQVTAMTVVLAAVVGVTLLVVVGRWYRHSSFRPGGPVPQSLAVEEEDVEEDTVYSAQDRQPNSAEVGRYARLK